MKSIDLLMHEHRLIDRGLAVLAKVAERLHHNEPVPADKVTALLDFFRVFADQCHHCKEEGLLFPELEARNIPREGGPIGVMLSEHDKGRQLQRSMRELASRLDHPDSRAQFIAAAQQFLTLLREHIWKEDNVLFRMAAQVLTDGEDQLLVQRFQQHETEQVGAGVHERHEHLIHDLEADLLKGAAQAAPAPGTGCCPHCGA